MRIKKAILNKYNYILVGLYFGLVLGFAAMVRMAEGDFEFFFIFDMQSLEIFLPILVCIIVFPYYKEIKGLSIYYYTRKNTYYWHHIKTILLYAFICSCLCFISYLIIYFGNFLVNDLTTSDYGRRLFNDIFGSNFYMEHKYLYYLLDGFMRYFILSFGFAVFGISITLFFDNPYLGLVSAQVYYVISVMLLQSINEFAWFTRYLSPAAILVGGSMDEVNTFALLLSLVPLLTISIGLVFWRLKDETCLYI